jgi:hypothetical protein
MLYYRYLIYATYSFFMRHPQKRQGPVGSVLMAVSFFFSANLVLPYLLVEEYLTRGRVDLTPTLRPFFLSGLLCCAAAMFYSLIIQKQLVDILTEFEVISPRGLNRQRAHLVVALFYLLPILLMLANGLLHHFLRAQ